MPGALRSGQQLGLRLIGGVSPRNEVLAETRIIHTAATLLKHGRCAPEQATGRAPTILWMRQCAMKLDGVMWFEVRARA